MQFAGKVAVIAGGGQGIGRAMAKALAARGCQVVVLARRQQVLDEVVSEITAAGGKARAHAVDVTDLTAVRAVCQQIRTEFGTPDILVHSAGGGRYLSIEETPSEEAAQMVNTRYLSAFYITREFVEEMIKRPESHIVVIGSSYVWMDNFNVAYKAAHHALHGFTEGLRTDLFDTPVHVMWVEPPTLSPETSFFANNPGAKERLPRFVHLITWTVDRLVAAIMDGIQRRKPFVTSFPIKLTRFLYPVFGRLILALSRSQMAPYEQGGPLSGARKRVTAGR